MSDATLETLPTDENDDNWLYGESTNDQREESAPGTGEKEQQETERAGEITQEHEKDQDHDTTNDDSHFNDEHFAEVSRDEAQANGDADSQDNADSDSDDSDDVKVTIGEIKSGPQAYASLNIKRGVGLVAAGANEKPRTTAATTGKVTLDDLDGPGSINGVPALEFNIDTIEDKPWNKPGADISDYFNYGFNEVTWSAYCERQRRMRVSEAGVGMHVGATPRPPGPDMRRPPGPMRNDEGMPPTMVNNYQARENTIQVMTAERREYGRSVHPRELHAPDYFAPPPPDHYYPPPPHAPYDEPWGHPEQSGWAPTEIKELTPGPGPTMVAPPMGQPAPMGPPSLGPPPVPAPHMMPAPPFAPPYRHHPPPLAHERDRDRDRDRDRGRDREDRDRRDRDRRDDEDRDRDRERERSRSMKPERIREKSYRRERSRSRSRRHKSRSRSPQRARDRSRERERSRDRERSVKAKSKESKDKEEDK